MFKGDVWPFLRSWISFMLDAFLSIQHYIISIIRSLSKNGESTCTGKSSIQKLAGISILSQTIWLRGTSTSLSRSDCRCCQPANSFELFHTTDLQNTNHIFPVGSDHRRCRTCLRGRSSRSLYFCCDTTSLCLPDMGGILFEGKCLRSSSQQPIQQRLLDTSII